MTHRRGRGWRGGFLGSAIEQYIKLDLNKWLKVLRHLELLPRPLGQDWSEIWLQRFSGTITIWPKSIPSDFWNILSDPSPQRLARMLHVGQQSAFPKIQFIKNRLKIEYEIMNGLQRTSPTGGRVLSPLLSRRLQGTDRENANGRLSDPMVERLDQALPERQPYPDEDLRDGDGPRYTEVPDYSPTDQSHPKTPGGRRNSVIEEMRRQSAVFFDDAEMYGRDDTVMGE